MRFAPLVAALALSPAPAWAQQLVATTEDAAPFHLSSRALGPIAEGGALLFFGNDIGTHASHAVRVGAAGTGVDPGLAADVAQIAACGGARWLLAFESLGMRGSRWHLRRDGGSRLWSRSFPTTALPDPRLGCAGGRIVLGWVDDGELVVADAAPSAAALRDLARVRVMPLGTIAQVPWAVAPRGDTIAVAVPGRGGSVAELLRIAVGAAGGAITHRAPLAGAPGPIAIDGDAVLVAFDAPARQGLVLAPFALADLAPRATASIPPSEPGRSVGCAGLWPGPGGRVAVAIDESWIGDGFVAIPQGPNEPDRFEPAYHSAGTLRLWEPANGRVGPPTHLGTRWAGAGGWLGDTLVLVQSVESAGVVGGIVQLRPARVRRFTPRP